MMDLVAPGVVNTMPEATLDASTTTACSVARRFVPCTPRPSRSSTTWRSGIDYDDVVQVLEDEGVDKFEVSWNELLEAVQAELERLAPEKTAADAKRT